MSAGTPYIGSKISLISKAEIRYEGILFEVNSKDSTVTLSKVRSFGTEDRPAAKHIQPRNEVYEYIIFRGSDIKDLSVSEMAKQEDPPQDPAIVSAQAMPRHQPPPQQVSSPPGMHPGIPPPPGPGYTPFPPTGMNSYNPFGVPYFNRPPLIMGQHHHPQPHPPPPPPSHIPPQQVTTTKAISPPKPVQASPLSSAPDASPSTLSNHDTSTPAVETTGIPPSRHISTGKDSSATSSPLTSIPPSALSSAPISSTIPLASLAAPTSDKPEDRLENLVESLDNKQTTTSAGSHEKSDKNFASAQNRTRPPTQRTHPQNGRGYNRGNGSSGYRRGMNPSRPRGTNHNAGPNPPPTTSSKPLRYDSEFDFETANSKFSKEELEVEIREKLRIEESPEEGEIEEVPLPHHQRIDDAFLPDGTVPSESSEECYDKNLSFFDTITCESNQPGGNKRANRNEERALNTETFGVAGFRGYGGKPRGSYNRGRGGYRSGRDYRGNYQSSDYHYNKGRGSNYRRGGGHRRGGYEETYQDGGYGQHGGRRNHYYRSRENRDYH